MQRQGQRDPGALDGDGAAPLRSSATSAALAGGVAEPEVGAGYISTPVSPEDGRRSGLRRADARSGALLAAPAFVLVSTFVLFPLGFAVYVSLTDWPLIGPYHFIGLTNYRNLFQDPVFIHTVIFAVTYTAIVTGPIFSLVTASPCWSGATGSGQKCSGPCSFSRLWWG